MKTAICFTLAVLAYASAMAIAITHWAPPCIVTLALRS